MRINIISFILLVINFLCATCGILFIANVPDIFYLIIAKHNGNSLSAKALSLFKCADLLSQSSRGFRGSITCHDIPPSRSYLGIFSGSILSFPPMTPPFCPSDRYTGRFICPIYINFWKTGGEWFRSAMCRMNEFHHCFRAPVWEIDCRKIQDFKSPALCIFYRDSQTFILGSEPHPVAVFTTNSTLPCIHSKIFLTVHRFNIEIVN